ncbi:MAG TPA: MFS transporter, partial [Caulobacteraceae bacterium]|nr:MFS transporter [Caulobacteraceae bacterium]
MSGLVRPVRPAAMGVVAVLTAMALVVLDAGVVNVALPSIGRALGAGPDRALLVVTAYQAGLIMALLPCGALGESLGHRRVFVWGVTLFTAASALCAAAPSLAFLVAARFVQGLGGAAVMALGVALLRGCVPQDRLGAAIGWNALTVALSSAAAPAIGAAVLSRAGWPWLFAANLPLGAVALVAARALPGGPGGGRPVDRAGMALAAAVFGLPILAVEVWPTQPLVSFALLGPAAVGLSALVQREASKPAPLIPLDLLKGRTFRLAA